jgi:eukaryotic-like serine/threonine-protein kinase
LSVTIGTKLGPYEITAPIGAGGMGEVYRARDMKLKRDVALKVLPEAFAGDPGRMLRFQREAEVLASLNHPNIAHIYGVEERALVMELVEGETLSGPLPIETAVNYARQIAEALEYAHERGVIHRDLKPANVKVTTEGTVKLLDFGLAKATEDPASASEDPSNSPTLTLGATRVGVIMGTAAYMSPEQANGKSVDKRADIWSFGAVLYEMLAGKKAFDGESVSDTLATVMKLEPDWTVLPQDVPASIHKLVRRCLTKDRKHRLRDIGEARIVLENPGETEVALQAESRPHPKIPWVIASVLGVALAALSFVYLRQPPPAASQVLQYTIEAPPKTNITNFAISPDGHYVAMTATSERGGQMWVRPLDSLQAQPLAGTEEASYPFWSPDSLYIGFFAGGKLKKISVAGGPAQTLCDAPVGSGGTWNSEGTIVFGSVSGLSRVSAAAGGVPNKVIEVRFSGFPTFLPDGRRFLYAVSIASKEAGVYLGSLDVRPGPQGRRVSVDVSNPQYLPPYEGSSHGYILFVREQTLMAQPVDPNSLQPAGDLFPVIEVSSRPGRNIYEYSISRNGILLYRTGSALRQHAFFDRSGKQLSAVGGLVSAPPGIVALSPNEKRMVSVRGVGAKIDLWITELERGTESRFTFDASRNVAPVWSPDGNYVAFSSYRGGSTDLYRKAANQAGQDELLWRSEFPKFPTDWSRDGRFIIFRQTSPGTKLDLFALPVTEDKKPIPLLNSEFNEIEGTVSPDGRWLAYASDESGSYEVYVQPFGPTSSKPATGKWQISIGGGSDPHWRGDGREMFYVAPNRKIMAVAVKTDGDGFVPSPPQSLFDMRFSVDDLGVSRYAVSADGQRFLIAADPETAPESPPLHVTVNWLAALKR